MQKTYISCANTAKLIRGALKRAFPGVKFSVVSSVYSGGASIRVKWTDGPTGSMVEAIAKQFAGGRFDGMIDMKIGVSHWLMPDGSVTIASNPGTIGSAGSIPAEREWMPSPDAKLVSFGADYVFCNRDLSERFLRHATARLARGGYEVFKTAPVVVSKWGSASVQGLDYDQERALHYECSRLVVA